MKESLLQVSTIHVVEHSRFIISRLAREVCDEFPLRVAGKCSFRERKTNCHAACCIVSLTSVREVGGCRKKKVHTQNYN